eukprot:gene13623-16034_t
MRVGGLKVTQNSRFMYQVKVPSDVSDIPLPPAVKLGYPYGLVNGTSRLCDFVGEYDQFIGTPTRLDLVNVVEINKSIHFVANIDHNVGSIYLVNRNLDVINYSECRAPYAPVFQPFGHPLKWTIDDIISIDFRYRNLNVNGETYNILYITVGEQNPMFQPVFVLFDSHMQANKFQGSFDNETQRYVIPFQIKSHLFDGPLDYLIQSFTDISYSELYTKFGSQVTLKITTNDLDLTPPLVTDIIAFPSISYTPSSLDDVVGWNISLQDKNGIGLISINISSDLDLEYAQMRLNSLQACDRSDIYNCTFFVAIPSPTRARYNQTFSINIQTIDTLSNMGQSSYGSHRATYSDLIDPLINIIDTSKSNQLYIQVNYATATSNGTPKPQPSITALVIDSSQLYSYIPKLTVQFTTKDLNIKDMPRFTKYNSLTVYLSSIYGQTVSSRSTPVPGSLLSFPQVNFTATLEIPYGFQGVVIDPDFSFISEYTTSKDNDIQVHCKPSSPTSGLSFLQITGIVISCTAVYLAIVLSAAYTAIREKKLRIEQFTFPELQSFTLIINPNVYASLPDVNIMSKLTNLPKLNTLVISNDFTVTKIIPLPVSPLVQAYFYNLIKANDILDFIRTTPITGKLSVLSNNMLDYSQIFDPSIVNSSISSLKIGMKTFSQPLVIRGTSYPLLSLFDLAEISASTTITLDAPQPMDIKISTNYGLQVTVDITNLPNVKSIIFQSELMLVPSDLSSHRILTLFSSDFNQYANLDHFIFPDSLTTLALTRTLGSFTTAPNYSMILPSLNNVDYSSNSQLNVSQFLFNPNNPNNTYNLVITQTISNILPSEYCQMSPDSKIKIDHPLFLSLQSNTPQSPDPNLSEFTFPELQSFTIVLNQNVYTSLPDVNIMSKLTNLPNIADDFTVTKIIPLPLSPLASSFYLYNLVNANDILDFIRTTPMTGLLCVMALPKLDYSQIFDPSIVNSSITSLQIPLKTYSQPLVIRGTSYPMLTTFDLSQISVNDSTVTFDASQPMNIKIGTNRNLQVTIDITKLPNVKSIILLEQLMLAPSDLSSHRMLTSFSSNNNKYANLDHFTFPDSLDSLTMKYIMDPITTAPNYSMILPSVNKVEPHGVTNHYRHHYYIIYPNTKQHTLDSRLSRGAITKMIDCDIMARLFVQVYFYKFKDLATTLERLPMRP